MEWKQLQNEQEIIHAQLRNVSRLNEQKRLIEKQLERAQQDIYKHSIALNHIRTKLDKLEGFSFMNMIRTWTGQQDELRAEKIDKAAVLELKINEAKKMQEDLTIDLAQAESKLTQINEQHLQVALNKLNAKKKGYLQIHEPEQAKKLEQLAHEEIVTKQLIIEMKEAEEAGENALTKLGQAAASLHSANGFSTWDTFLGGGLIATHLKHDALNQSENYLHDAQIALQRFHNELLDIHDLSTKSLHVETDGFVKFADYFFDDIFSAWSVHSKISTAREQVSRVQDDVHNTIWRLQDKHHKAVEHLQLLEREKEAIFQL
ncbi:hypothetical protein [Lysinibacillus pakistanensis]|uniref:Uncharacterized protein n=1 Tax=Lysinibacillus pakistanensis TaxID=759811 RepID=A0AAX3WPW5_9BACI|nr:hypothetical protein [Lysinibacillus pakistanensis]MDM5234222.1 hypothetical protein [Lysinibacillus pakistanensis]WHY44813.1 hypothetical protein QNH22_15985 [Lysinibacillus pakistanensis]WHY49821.1 hypothetical protein QNH24_15955 [Lysinibacillus pakistanensis]